jgi:hypothetical protein
MYKDKYTGVRKFKFQDLNSNFEIIISIDFNNKFVEEEYDLIGRIESMVKFWMGWDATVKLNDGDYVKVFTRQFAEHVAYMSAQGCARSQIEQTEGYMDWVIEKYGITFEYEPLEIELDLMEVPVPVVPEETCNDMKELGS